MDPATLEGHIIAIREQAADTNAKVNMVVGALPPLFERVGKLERQHAWIKGVGAAIATLLAAGEYLMKLVHLKH